MQISIFGTGYVGLVSGVCFAEMGNDVTCIDIDASKVKTLQGGKCTIYEPGLEEMMKANIDAKRLSFTTDARPGIQDSDILIIAVQTPSDRDGSADLKYVLQVAETIAENMNGEKFVVTRSTVPVGTHKLVREKIELVLARRGVKHEFHVISNPEFLREGAAIEETMKPARVIIGTDNERAANLMRRLYEPFLKKGQPLIQMDALSSEMTKYAANSMLAARISLMNEYSRLCDKVGADIELVRRGLGTDPRIGPHFIYPGLGYGGSCFPKDVRALIRTGQDFGEPLGILEQVAEGNEKQKRHYIKKVLAAVGDAKGKTLAVWGVSFKPFTDDIREAPALEVIEALLKAGARVQAYDPAATENAARHLGPRDGLKFCADQYAALEGADALCVITEWKSFREPNFKKMQGLLKQPLIVDGRNIYNPRDLKDMGFRYVCIGRPAV